MVAENYDFKSVIPHQVRFKTHSSLDKSFQFRVFIAQSERIWTDKKFRNTDQTGLRPKNVLTPDISHRTRTDEKHETSDRTESGPRNLIISHRIGPGKNRNLESDRTFPTRTSRHFKPLIGPEPYNYNFNGSAILDG